MNQVLIDDGATQWVADVEELSATMRDHGWAVGAGHHTGATEVAQPAADDSLQPYTDLCQDVQPVAGEGSERELTETMRDSLPQMYLCCGEWVADQPLIDALRRIA